MADPLDWFLLAGLGAGFVFSGFLRHSGRTGTSWATVDLCGESHGVPDNEGEVLGAAEETALEHGSGLGLWLVTWGCARSAGRSRSKPTRPEPP